MKKITVCIGSSCHLKGSRQVVEALQDYITEHDLKDKVSLSGAFCMKNCREGVSVTVDGVLFSVTPETVGSFFETEILKKL
ncbi:MAG: (2Fe-2S) ferredoxin domain-containing protein [Clostridia bacterium]|nr:(2Fe-2S) ferredoxin domain-containing protein [Clostridia bacterium]